MKDLTGRKKSFYEDQHGPKTQSLSEEVDAEFDEECAAAVAELSMQITEDLVNESFSNPPEFQEAMMPSPVAHSKRERRKVFQSLYERGVNA